MHPTNPHFPHTCAARNSQLYVKELEVGGAALPRPGKRIGF